MTQSNNNSNYRNYNYNYNHNHNCNYGILSNVSVSLALPDCLSDRH